MIVLLLLLLLLRPLRESKACFCEVEELGVISMIGGGQVMVFEVITWP